MRKKFLSFNLGILIMFFVLGFFFESCKSEKKQIKVVIIGLDGANWETLDPLIKKGKLKYFEELKKKGAWGYLKTIKPTESAVIWTSIATGKSMIKHGIIDFVYVNKKKIKIPYTNSERRVPTLWQILSNYNLKSIVINWYVSYPPDKIKGIIVSDKFRHITMRKNQGKNYRDTVFPEKVFNELKKFAQFKLIKEAKKYDIPLYNIAFKIKYPQEKTYPIVSGFPIFLKHDIFVLKISDYLYRRKDFDLFATYIRMPDIVQHIALKMFGEKRKKEILKKVRASKMSAKEKRKIITRISDIIKPAYSFSEILLKKIINNPKYKNTYFFIVSDHGFTLGPDGYNHYALPDDYPPPYGIFLLIGPKVKKGFVKDVSVFDIAPTVLYLMGLPVGKEMDGKPLKNIFLFKKNISYKIYKLKKNRKSKKGYGKQTLDNLKTIGYIN